MESLLSLNICIFFLSHTVAQHRPQLPHFNEVHHGKQQQMVATATAVSAAETCVDGVALQTTSSKHVDNAVHCRREAMSTEVLQHQTEAASVVPTGKCLQKRLLTLFFIFVYSVLFFFLFFFK